MRRHILCTGLAILLPGAAVAAEPAPVAEQELALGGITLGDRQVAVVDKLGKASRNTDEGDYLGVRMEYPGLTVWLDEDGRVGELLSTSRHYCTPGGICPGVRLARVEAKYGPPIVADREHGRFMEYVAADTSCWLQLAVSKGVVKSVRVQCQL